MRYLEPGTNTLSLPGVDGVRVYVLGPPRDTSLLGITDRASEMYGLAGAEGWGLATSLNAAFALAIGSGDPLGDAAAPFDSHVGSPLDATIAAGNSPDQVAIRAGNFGTSVD